MPLFIDSLLFVDSALGFHGRWCPLFVGRCLYLDLYRRVSVYG